MGEHPRQLTRVYRLEWSRKQAVVESAVVGGVLEAPGVLRQGGMQLVKSYVQYDSTPAISTVAVGWRKLNMTMWEYRGLSMTTAAHLLVTVI